MNSELQQKMDRAERDCWTCAVIEDSHTITHGNRGRKRWQDRMITRRRDSHVNTHWAQNGYGYRVNNRVFTRAGAAHQIKRSAKKALRKYLDVLPAQLRWLQSLPNCDALLEGVPVTKLKHMADAAAVPNAGELKDFRPAKRHAMVLSRIRQMRPHIDQRSRHGSQRPR